jgi:hypothetical protein
MHWKSGDIIRVPFGSRILEAIVIDPNGLAPEQPSIGMGFAKIDRHVGIPHNTLSDWVVEIEGLKYLKLPSGSTFRVVEITGNDGNIHFVVEICDWMTLAADLVKNQGKVRKTTINKVVDFIAWFAVDGFYAQAYVMLGIVYGQRTHDALQRWKEARGLGIPVRKQYASYLADRGEISQIGKWTNIIYIGLFGCVAKKMIKIWETQAGRPDIARNHIPEEIGLQAVAYCERLVVTLDLDNLRECHKAAIELTRKKFRLDQNSARLAA